MRCLLLLPLLALAACASTTEVSTRYRADVTPPPVDHLLVVARTPEKLVRRQWENSCADALDELSLTLTRSHTVLPLWYEPGTDRLEQWALANGADAILVAELTRLVLPRPDLSHPDVLNRDRGGLEDSIGEPEWSFFIGRKEKEEEPWPIYQEIQLQLVAADGKGLWAGTTLTHEANAINAIAHSQCRALGKRFIDMGLLPE